MTSLIISLENWTIGVGFGTCWQVHVAVGQKTLSFLRVQTANRKTSGKHRGNVGWSTGKIHQLAGPLNRVEKINVPLE